MADPRLESGKDAVIQAVTEIYARGGMDMPAFERSVAALSACGDLEALQAEAGALGIDAQAVMRALAPAQPRAPAARPESALAAGPPEGAIRLECVSGNLRQEGQWVRASAYELRLKSSSARLDLREYEDASGLRLVLDIDAQSSTIRLTVPRGFEVQDRLSERVSSSVHNKAKESPFGGNLVVLEGRLRSSVLKVKYK